MSVGWTRIIGEMGRELNHTEGAAAAWTRSCSRPESGNAPTKLFSSLALIMAATYNGCAINGSPGRSGRTIVAPRSHVRRSAARVSR